MPFYEQPDKTFYEQTRSNSRPDWEWFPTTKRQAGTIEIFSAQ